MPQKRAVGQAGSPHRAGRLKGSADADGDGFPTPTDACLDEPEVIHGVNDVDDGLD